MKKQIRFKSQYLYLVSELIDNAFFVEKSFKNKKVCFIDSGIFSFQTIKLLKQSFSEFDIIKDYTKLPAKQYDLILAPFVIQFLEDPKHDFSKIYDSLNAGGILLTSAFNILENDNSIVAFKNFLDINNKKAQLVDFFILADLINKFGFKDKTLDRENLLIEGQKVELINLFCLKNGKKKPKNTIKIVIS